MRIQYLITAVVICWVLWSSSVGKEDFMDVVWSGPRSYPNNGAQQPANGIKGKQQEILDAVTLQHICSSKDAILNSFNQNRRTLEYTGLGSKPVATVQQDVERLGRMLTASIKAVIKQDNLQYVDALVQRNLWTNTVRQITLDLQMANPSVYTSMQQYPSITVQCVVLYDNDGIYLQSIKC